MIVEKQMECRLAGETEVLGENLPQRHFLSITKSHMTKSGFEPGPSRWESVHVLLKLIFVQIASTKLLFVEYKIGPGITSRFSKRELAVQSPFELWALSS
jgi:hypothetical protein